ncbi:MAG: hypothetical protein IKI28_06955 [Bacteroidales bacterium]|nr:hypothetical protein [Bacteroidales bacterium]
MEIQSKLQELTEKIYREGLEKGQDEANQLLAQAKADAARIVSEAKAQAEQLKAAAQKEAADMRKNAETEINLSAKQVMGGLKQQIAAAIEAKLYKAPAIDALKDAEFMKSVISAAISRWNPNSTERVSLNLLVPADMQQAIGEHFSAKALDQLNADLHVNADRSIKYGFKIGPGDGGYVVSFTEADFDALFKDYMRPKIAALLFGNK